MDEQIKTKLQSAAEAATYVAEAYASGAQEIAEMRQAMEALTNKELGGIAQEETDTETEWLRFLEAIERMLECVAAEEKALLFERDEIPRPPKRLGPVNKANYQANRPTRRARSSCRIIKR